LFERDNPEPIVEIPFMDGFRIGNVYAMTIFDLDYENIDYGFRFDGPWDPSQGHVFDPSTVVMDPYARSIGGRDVWAQRVDPHAIYKHRARPVIDDFDWEGDTQLEIPLEDLIIYEMHVRGFTASPTSGVAAHGTFDGLREKIPYLKALGVNCVELMPVFEFDEWEHSRISPETGEILLNYWGYSTVGFFAPKAGYAATGRYDMQMDELKNLIKELHRSGIEVILDEEFNHTAEGNELGPVISFKGIDNKTYYMLTPDGYYYNFSGTGNTLNCNHPVVRNVVLDCLCYLDAVYHVDGLRFDLASILGRDQNGAPLSNPPLLEALAHDPILAGCKLIAEAWDAGGLYQVGSFPDYGRFAEWNGRFRDTVRRFIKGDEGMLGDLAQRVQGSPDMYSRRRPTASVNFVTCHDGFTLMDMVSYNSKHNLANGEDNRDGQNDNYSWNCGHEGPTDNQDIHDLRRRQIKNAVTILMISQGVPMLLMGDEYVRTKHGNNNTYCHDSPLTWFDWGALEENDDLFGFFQGVIAFRKAHQVLRRREHFKHRDVVGSGWPDITWHGTQAWYADWSHYSRVLAFMLDGAHARGGLDPDDSIYVAMNAYWEPLTFELPLCPGDGLWHAAIDTYQPPGWDVAPVGEEPPLEDQSSYQVGPRSVVVLVGREEIRR
ncbi:MAG: glycogen debranching protein, partial [Anaerolineae bacterium]